MSIKVGEDIGLEIHPNVDQFLRVEQGQGIVQMGKSKDNLSFKEMSLMILQSWYLLEHGTM